jgi:hypothetical protein
MVKGVAERGVAVEPLLTGDAARAVLADWFRRVRNVQHTHYACANHFSRLNTLLGVPTFILSFVVASYVFASVQLQASGFVKIVVGLTATLVGALALLHTYLGFGQRSESHRRTSARYGALRRKIELLAAFVPNDPETFSARMATIKHEADEIADGAPEIPERIQQSVLAQLRPHPLFKSVNG